MSFQCTASGTPACILLDIGAFETGAATFRNAVLTYVADAPVSSAIHAGVPEAVY